MFKRILATPTKVIYGNPDNLNQKVEVTSQVKPVNRKNGKFNHIRQRIRIADMVKPPRMCEESCEKSPVVLTVEWSAPEGVSATAYAAALDKLRESIEIGTVFLDGPTQLDINLSADS